MGFHFTVSVGSNQYTWKSSYRNAEVICELATSCGVSNALADSANAFDESVELTVRELLRQIQAMQDRIQADKDLLFMSYAYRLKNIQTGKFGKATTQYWYCEESELSQDGIHTYTGHCIVAGKSELFLRKWVAVGPKGAEEEVLEERMDLRNHDQFTLPNGEEIKVVRKPMKDTLTAELADLSSWLNGFLEGERVEIESG